MDWLGRWMNADLARWEKRPFSVAADKGPRSHDNRDNHERIVGWEAAGLPEADGIARRVADAILCFDVFPPSLLAGVTRRMPVQIGDTIGLRHCFVPGLDLFFATRVIDRFEKLEGNLWRCGFTYRTLIGHPACGEETFVVEKDLTTGRVTAALRSWSRPGLWIARLTYPIMRQLQLRAGGAALDHLEEIAHPGKPEPLLGRRNLRTGLLRSAAKW